MSVGCAKWLLKNMPDQNQLAKIYEQGAGVSKNYKEILN
jgi:hypothetical protein